MAQFRAILKYMALKIIKEKISQQELQKIAEAVYGTMVKMAVDIQKKIIALGAEWHSECQEALINRGSQTKDIWGVNLVLKKPSNERLEFIALINVKPSSGHYDMEITDEKIKKEIRRITDRLIEE